MITSKPIFVISDLHMGNGSSLDQFRRAGAEQLFLNFLDHVVHQEGQLIITGDLLELWRFSLAEVIDHRSQLLERLTQIAPVYIPGNHDVGATSAQNNQGHPLFQCVQSSLTVSIGGRRFCFMHGHEQDPFIKDDLYSRTLPSCLSPVFSLKDRVCRWKGDMIPDLVLEGGERVLGFLRGDRHGPLHRIHPELHYHKKRHKRGLSCSLRTQKMLSRYHYDKDQKDYDVALLGHSHKAGQYGNWYFNSGCWIGARHSFLKIWPDGHVEVFDWEQGGLRSNQTVVWGNLPTGKATSTLIPSVL